MQGGGHRLTEPILAVDAGQTETRATLYDEGRPRLVRASGVGRIDAPDGGAEAVASTLLRAVAALGDLPETPPAVGVGLSGIEAAREDELARLSDALRDGLRAPRVAIASDGVTSLLGALDGAPGGVVSAGTGTIAVAYDGRRWAKVDGWGSLVGDAGSGLAIGRAGLDAAMREYDGRGGSRSLLRAAERAHGPPEQLVSRIHRTPVPTVTVAAFATAVAEEASAGDDVAMEIVTAAGRELAVSASAALRRVFDADERVAVSYAGNVFRAGAPLLRSFEHELAGRCPHAVLVAPHGDSLAGAALLARRAEQLDPEPGLLWLAG